ncbi:uncharacterized protein J7T54_008297 [Emericellopsis cladophorae]|uniref:AA1-like domain-containing protein n=1 Tax=Emericellopsis cladophorae TaxID=2686198 RepID=A0A9P9XWE0_9HYPO|nr:uncharacterized protein J7T54_008297 [Emericellopsis cladophorae]KAI6779079.1 hypothetical protein J7T54_008297 [Emericellopsis cladophorae]
MISSLLLGILPSVAYGAQLAYSPPQALMAFAVAADDCIFPADFEVRDFGGISNSTNGTTLRSLDFSFTSTDTEVTTLCHYNSTSEPSVPPGRTPRYKCEDGDVEFIWENDKTRLTMIERVCSGSDGVPDYEAAGSVRIPLTCKPMGKCATNATVNNGKFTNISPAATFSV